MIHLFRASAFLLAILLAQPFTAQPAWARDLISLGTTTSVDNSGLLKPLIERFTADTGIAVRTIVQGTGAILRSARSGDIDVALVHDRAAEDAFVAAGDGAFRRNVMTSRFFIVGPKDDPAGISRFTGPAAALARIADAEASFVSRGDQSGTHTAERRFWQNAKLSPKSGTDPWYRESGSGMGPTLNIAAALGAYTLTESGSWVNFGNRGGLVVHVDSPATMANPYGIILVNPARHRHVSEKSARIFIDWLAGEVGQSVIADFALNGEHPFRPASAKAPAN